MKNSDNIKIQKAIFLGVISIIIALFMLLTGCTQETGISTEFKTYSKYGFSFDYPKRFPVEEMVLRKAAVETDLALTESSLIRYHILSGLPSTFF